ncbi:MAG TPA: hypothetical protein VEH27_09940 [Methylomirabilota bacterium]|nr:hypothetical protein [Methylomirabilota bacterium]
MARVEIPSFETEWDPSSTALPDELNPKDEARWRWRLKTTVGAYLTFGERDARWNAAALDLLTNFALATFKTNDLGTFARNAVEAGEAALEAGCNDPFVRYCTTWFKAPLSRKSPSAEAMQSTAAALYGTKYPPIRKFYAFHRAAQVLKEESGKTNPPALWELRINALNCLHSAIEDPTIPAEEALPAIDNFLEPVQRARSFSLPAFKRLEPVMTNRWANEALTWHIVGAMNIEFAWEARGSGFSSTVTDEGWQGFAEHLSIAEKALERSWKIKPLEKAAIEMLRVELGQGQGRQRMELWFNRAMQLNPNSYEAANAKLFYLEPKWHGSAEEMLAFGRQCVNSEIWGGRVPLILLDAHVALAAWAKRNNQTANYWTQQGVWPDIRSSFEKFFKLNPKDSSWRHNYAYYAYQCQEYAAFLKQVELMGPVNYPYFGGKEKFDLMLQTAKRFAR